VSLQAIRWLAAVLLLAMAMNARAGDAVPENTSAEKSYLLLRDSKDTKTQLLAKRWYGLVQLQDWTDATGKFQSTAKYLEQDEKQGTVKLRVIKGSGKDQVVTDRTISVDKLNKECQARVKQIAFLAEKVDEAEKAEADKVAAPKEGQQAMGGMTGPPGAERGGRGGISPGQPPDKMGGPPPRGKADRASGRDRSKSATTQAEHLDVRRPPDAGAPVQSPLPVVAAATAEADDSKNGSRSAQPANVPDQQPWRTSFDTFRGNFSATKDETGKWKIEFGDLTDLKSESALLALAVRSDKSSVPIDGRRRVLADAKLASQHSSQVTWQAQFIKTRNAGAVDMVDFDLPKLPEPLELGFWIDDKKGSTVAEWSRFSAGDVVGFTGDVSMVNERLVVVRVRNPVGATKITSPIEAVTSASSTTAAIAKPVLSKERFEERPVQPANLPDEKPWRTSFEAFRGNLTAARGRSSWELGWGELDALKQAYEKATAQVAATADPNASLSAAELDALGEVAWEASLAEQPDEQTDWSKALGLTLPEPFKIVCKLDNERGPGDWHRFFPGDRVKFIGHFTGFGGGDDFGAVGHIQIAIRFPEDVRAAVPVRKGP
jgi:hypothetical protein